MSFKKYRKKKENDTARVARSEAFKQEILRNIEKRKKMILPG